jgi:hypothetical protein
LGTIIFVFEQICLAILQRVSDKVFGRLNKATTYKKTHALITQMHLHRF